MTQEKKAPRGKWWCIGITPEGIYVPYLEKAADAPSRRFKLESACKKECDKRNSSKVTSKKVFSGQYEVKP